MPNKIKYLTETQIISLHESVIKKSGGISGIRDIDRLRSSIAMVNVGFGDVERFETLEEKAAAYLYFLIVNQSFFDGNKRIGTYAAYTFLDMNKYPTDLIKKTNRLKLIDLAWGIASCKYNIEETINQFKLLLEPLHF